MPTLADTGQSWLAFLKESTFAMLPAGAFTKLRHTSEGIEPNISTNESEEIRDDYQVPDISQGGLEYQGDIGIEWSYGNTDPLLEGLLRGTWTAANSITAATISVANSDNSYNDSMSGFTFGAGDWVLVSGFANAENNGLKRITSATAAKIIVAGAALTTEAAGPSATIKHSGRLVNGTTLSSFVLQKGFDDVAQYQAILGCRIGAGSLQMVQRGKMTGSLSIMGVREQRATSPYGGAPSEAPTNNTMDASNNLHALQLDETDPAVVLLEFGFDINGKLRGQPQAMSKEWAGIGSGTFSMGVTGKAYFENYDEYAKAVAGTKHAWAVAQKDASGNYYVFYWPKSVGTVARIVQGGRDSDVVAEFAFGAHRDPTLNSTINVTRIDA